MTIRGKWVYVDLEGGFWGIEGEDQKKYHVLEGIPSTPPASGSSVIAEIEPSQSITFQMWGRPVRLLNLKIQE